MSSRHLPLPALQLDNLSLGFFRSAGSGAANPNLLLWTEEMDNAVWVKSGGVTVSADFANDPAGNLTADRVTSPALDGAIAQISATAAAVGAAVTLDYALTSSWSRQEVVGSFDGLSYTFSVHLKAGDIGAAVRLQLDRSGGFLRVQVIDRADGLQVLIWGAQLEQSVSSTAYQKRSGV